MNYQESQQQRAFNEVVQHLREQGKPSLTNGPGTMCRYRGEGGTKCAIGVLIADSYYRETIEGLHAGIPTVLRALADSGWDDLPQKLLMDLQRIHDDAATAYAVLPGTLTSERLRDSFLGEVEQGVTKVAVKWDLNIPD